MIPGQTSLLDPAPRARKTDPATSLAAAKSVTPGVPAQILSEHPIYNVTHSRRKVR